MSKVQSSKIREVEYVNNKDLDVLFYDGACRYFDVPVEKYNNLMAADSVGKYLTQHIEMAGYRYTRIDWGAPDRYVSH